MDSYRLQCHRHRHHFFLVVAYSLIVVKHVSSTAGPVFINPNAAPIHAAPLQSASEGNYVTQTVYGFLDFTTTIGNTVMVFSPQSAAVPETASATAAGAPSAVIDTSRPVEGKAGAIKPSKTLTGGGSQADGQRTTQQVKKVASVTEVRSATPGPAVGATSPPPSRVDVVEGQASAVSGAAQVASSKVEIVKAAPTSSSAIITKVEVISGPANALPPSIVSSKVDIVASSEGPSSPPPPPPPLVAVSSVVEVRSAEEDDGGGEQPAVIVGNNIGEPEYDFLSRQPSEVVEETYKVINLKPSAKFHLKARPSADAKHKAVTKRGDSLHPTGLVTKLGGTVVKDGVTTVHETSVIGTYISGKYAQVLQSTSHIHQHHHHHPHQKGKISPSPTLRIQKTAAPSLGKGNKHHRHLEPTPAGSINEETALSVEALFHSQNSIKSTRKPTGPGGGGPSFKPRFKSRQKDAEIAVEEDNNEQDFTPHSNYNKKNRNRTQQQSPNLRNSKHNTSQHRPHKFGRGNRKSTTTTSTVSVHSEEATSAPSFGTGKRYQSNRRNKQQRTTSSENNYSNGSGGGYSRRGYKPKVQTSTVEQVTATTSLYKFKLNRSPGRWQYKTTPKPRVTIRKQIDEEQSGNNATVGATPPTLQDVSPVFNDVVTPQARSDDVDGLEGSESIASIIDDESSTENKLDNTPFPLETIKVEISTPPDFKDVYYEIATIKSPYTFQVGNVKNTRFITVTSTFERSLTSSQEPAAAAAVTAAEPLTENILATSSNYAKDNNFLDSSVATLPPIYLASDMETPPLETITETFSTTQTMLKTHVLPVVRSGNETASSTLVQTYVVTRLVAATKTLPPMEAYHFIPSKTLNEFNSHLDEAGSELHLELEFGDQNEQEEDGRPARKAFPADLDLASVGSDFSLADVDRARLPAAEGLLRPKKAPARPPAPEPAPPTLSPDQLQQLALLRLFNPGAAAAAQVITTSRPVLRVETVYESHVIPVTNGANTVLSTISKAVGTVTKTDYELGTSTVAPALPLPPVPLPAVNPLFAQPQFAVTTSPVVQSTLVTQTNSKILKLTFGAKTAYTTIFSSTIVPTLVTSYMTASIPVQPTQPFPGFYPAPYPGYPFVG